MSETTRTPVDSTRSTVCASGSHSSSSVRWLRPSAAGRQRPLAPVRLADREERSGWAQALDRGDETAEDERRAEAQRGVVAAELVAWRRPPRRSRCGPRGPAAATRCRAVATNSGARSTHVSRQPNVPARMTRRPAAARGDVERRVSQEPRPSRSPSRRIFSALVGFWSSCSASTTACHQSSSAPPQVRVVRHAPAAGGLHLDRLERAVIPHARPPDDQVAEPRARCAARAPGRGSRAPAPARRDRARGPRAGSSRRTSTPSSGCGSNRGSSCASTSLEQLAPRSRPRARRPRRRRRPARSGRLAAPRSARRRAPRRAMDRDAGLVVARHDRALDRRGAAPARQQRRMDVEPERALEQLVRDQEAVGADDDRVGGDLDGSRRASRAARRGSRAAPPTSFAGGGASCRPRPRGLSGRVSSCTTSCSAASRSSTSAPNGAVAATAIRRAMLSR